MPTTDRPTAQQYADFIAQLLDMRDKTTGRRILTPGQVRRAIMLAAGGRTWGEIIEALREFARVAGKRKQGVAYLVTAGDLPGQWRGFTPGTGQISSTEYRGMEIDGVAVGHGSNAGKVRLSMAIENGAVDQDLFRAIRLNGQTLRPEDASYNPVNQTWRWNGTSVEFEVGKRYSLVIRHDADPEDMDFTFVAADAGDGFVGYEPNGNGLVLRGVRIGRFVTNAALQGIFVLDLELGAVPLPQDIFDSLVINGWELFSHNATYDPDMQTWVWTNTGFHFNEGQEYTVTVKV